MTQINISVDAEVFKAFILGDDAHKEEAIRKMTELLLNTVLDAEAT